MQFRFGTGAVYGTPLTDAYGNAIANPTPVKLGVLQEFSCDVSRDIKELYGQNTFAVDAAMGKTKLSGKAKVAQVSGLLFASLIFGQPLTTGQGAFVAEDIASVIPATPFAVTVTPPNTGTFLFDLGVRDAAGANMVRVAATPTAGQYSVSATGVYTFAAADTLKPVYISYQYVATVAAAKNLGINNLKMGTLPTFRIDYTTTYKGKIYNIALPNCVAAKTNLASTKMDDYDVFEFDYVAFADPVTGSAINMTLSE